MGLICGLMLDNSVIFRHAGDAAGFRCGHNVSGGSVKVPAGTENHLAVLNVEIH